MAVPDAHLLFAVCRADARIHVEHDASRRTATMNAVDPLAGQIGESGKVLFRCEPARLEAAHLARRCRCPQRRLAANNPTHRGIMTQALGVVDILISGEAAEHRLPQHADQGMATVLTGAVGENLAGHRTEAERIVEFPVREQAGVGGDHRSAKLEHQPAVEIESENSVIRFTRRVRHAGGPNAQITC
jgi:hypothetical protein